MLKSIERKNLPNKSYIKSLNIANEKRFTTYRNKLDHLLRLAEKLYILRS